MKASHLLPTFCFLLCGALTGLTLICQKQAAILAEDMNDKDQARGALEKPSGRKHPEMRLKIHNERLSDLKKLEDELPQAELAKAVKPTEGKTLPGMGQLSRKQLADTRNNINVRAYQEVMTEQRLNLEKEMEEIMQREEDFDNPFSFRDLTNPLA